MTIGKWGDAVGHPSGDALRANGYTGMWAYVGTPGNGKNLTTAVYREWAAAGLEVGGIFEVTTTDFATGRAAGVAHAQAAMVDMTAMGIPHTAPIGPTVDQHLSAGQVSVAVAYQAGFHDTVRAAGWVGPVAAYGFAEFITAAAAAGVADVLWQCGSRSAVGGNVHFWQDNTGTDMVAGVQVDRDWQLLPIPGGNDMQPTDPIPFTNADGTQIQVAAEVCWANADIYAGNAMNTVRDPQIGNAALAKKLDDLATAVSNLASALAKPTTSVPPTKLVGTATVPIEVDLAPQTS